MQILWMPPILPAWVGWRDHLGVPAIMIEVDHADVRKYGEENAFLGIEALLETIETQRQ